MTPPLALRRLKAAMELKALDLRTVAERAQVDYTSASRILNGRLIAPAQLERLRNAIESAPMPKEVAA